MTIPYSEGLCNDIWGDDTENCGIDAPGLCEEYPMIELLSFISLFLAFFIPFIVLIVSFTQPISQFEVLFLDIRRFKEIQSKFWSKFTIIYATLFHFARGFTFAAVHGYVMFDPIIFGIKYRDRDLKYVYQEF